MRILQYWHFKGLAVILQDSIPKYYDTLNQPYKIYSFLSLRGKKAPNKKDTNIP